MTKNRKANTRQAPKKRLEEFGPTRKRAPAFEPESGGNTEFGFMPRTIKGATAAMSGRGLPPIRDAPSITKGKRKQFKAGGKKVF